MSARVFVKICCIASVDEAMLAIHAGADAIGLVAEMPSGPGPIADEDIQEIASAVPPPIATFLLTSRTDPDAIAEHAAASDVNTVQIVDRIAPKGYALIRRQLPYLKIVQVIHVQSEADVDEAISLSPAVDALLLDSGNPDKAVKELGGTGRTHDWSLSRRIVEDAECPVFLAGGLNADNVAEAIKLVRPHGVDICSGVRTNNNLDGGKLAAFMANVSACQSGAS